MGSEVWVPMGLQGRSPLDPWAPRTLGAHGGDPRGPGGGEKLIFIRIMELNSLLIRKKQNIKSKICIEKHPFEYV